MSIDRPDSPRNFSEMAKSHWLGWPPQLVGGVAWLMFALTMLATIWNMYQRADRSLQDSIQRELLATARSIAQVVDPELHRTFTMRDQEKTAPYEQQIRRMENARAAIDVNGMIKFVYTCIAQGDQIRFVLDTTPEGDADHDGKDDKSHIMELYEQPSATLRSVLATSVAAVDHVPYQDRWGTFMSAYAPVFDARHRVVAVAGVDVALTDYDLERSSVRNIAMCSAVGALCLSFVAALGVAAYHRRLQRSITDLVASGEAAMAAVRTKSNFLAAMSHELRTPMNAVLGMSELLSDTTLTDRQRAFLDTIQCSGESLLAIITDILDFSQLDTGPMVLERVPVSLRAILDKLEAHFARELQQKGLVMTVEIEAACEAPFLLDPQPLRQVLQHLIANAVKFTDKGSISVRVNRLLISPGRPGLHFVVTDTGIGIGITGEQQSQLFQPFFQADDSTTRRHGGAGLGLAICKRLSDAMEGRLWVKSEPGKGSSFHLEVPAHPASVPQEESAEHEALLLSHDSTTEMLVTRVIEKQRHGVRVVKTLEDLDREHSARPVRWLLLDSALMTATHLSFLASLRQKVSVIILNAEPGKYVNHSFDAVLFHPLRPAELREALDS